LTIHVVINIIARILRIVRKIIKHTFSRGRSGQQIKKLYLKNEYLEAYSRHSDFRVEEDPKEAVGGMWEEIGLLQFEFLINNDLQPHHKMLDLGCGTLRGGRHFIKYLNPGNYYGIDISTKAIMFAEELVKQEGLSEKKPHLLVSENKDLKFREFSDENFDYILAQSVFTHLKPEHIKECFENIGQIMHKNSVYYFTYNKGEEFRQTGLKDFIYPFSFFESLARHYGYNLQDRSKDYSHPRDQIMVELRKD
jgi:SAM-dependent methyltransferase